MGQVQCGLHMQRTVVLVSSVRPKPRHVELRIGPDEVFRKSVAPNKAASFCLGPTSACTSLHDARDSLEFSDNGMIAYALQTESKISLRPLKPIES